MSVADDRSDDTLSSGARAGSARSGAARFQALGAAMQLYQERKDRGLAEGAEKFLERNEPLRDLLAPLVAGESRPAIPDYLLVRRLGRGAFGEVWLARSQTGVHRAVKVIYRSKVQSIEFDGIYNLENFATPHPNVIEIKHVGKIAEGFYYVMPLADGYATSPTFNSETYEPRTLEAELKRRGRIALPEAAAIADGLLAGLDSLHARGLLHRDVKPGNVVWVDGVVKLADLGLVARGAAQMNVAHTPLYAPPQGVVDRTGDFYCLARMLYEMVSGLAPDSFPRLPDASSPQLRAETRKLLPIIERACAGEAAARYQTAGEFRAALRGAIELESLSTRRRTRTARALAISGIAAASVFFGFRYLSPPGRAASAKLQVMVAEHGSRIPAELRVPIASGSKYQLEATLDGSAYLLLVYVSTQDPPQLVHQTAQPVERLSFPEGDRVLPALPNDQTHTFVLLASHEPFADAPSILKRIAALGPAQHVDSSWLLALKDGVVEVLPASARARAVDFSKTDDQPRQLLYRLPAALARECELVSAVSFTQCGSPDVKRTE